MKRVLVFICFLLPLCAQEEVLLTRQADAYFQAKEFDEAKALFDQLKGYKMPSWQKERVIFNIGTILLEKGEYDQAQRYFASIPYTPKATPLLDRALQTNLAILKYRKALQAIQVKKETLEQYSRAFYLFRQALIHIDKAKEASCSLQEIEGRQRCHEEEDLIELRSAIKKKLAVTAQKFSEKKISQMSVKEGIPFLISGIDLAQSHLEFMNTISLDTDQKKEYLKLYSTGLDSWRALWETQQERLELIEPAYAEFIQGVENLRDGRLKESQIAFLSSEASLTQLMKTMWGDDPVRDLLQKLIGSYQRALDQVPLQPPSLYRLVAQQNQIQEFVEGSELYIKYLDFSDAQLKSSLEYARKAKRFLSRFYLEEARQWIRRILRGSENPEEVLEDAIEDQIHALTLNQLADEIEQDKTTPFSTLKGAQKFTLQTALPFIRIVLEKQKRDWPEVCQCKPWKQVIPLFVKGEMAAISAQKILKDNPEDPLAMIKQEEAVKYWKEALEKMRHPDEDQTPPSPPQEKEPQTSMDEVMRQLQNMSKDDRKPKPDSKEPQKGIRPW